MLYDDRTLLGDYIYQLHKEEPFYGKKAGWSDPICVFSASTEESIEDKVPKFVKSLREKNLLREDTDDLICVLGDWESVAEGIMFTSKAIYVNSPKNKPKKFRVRYDDITEMTLYRNLNELCIVDHEGRNWFVTTKLWNARSIKIFLDFASRLNQFSDSERELVDRLSLPHCDNRSMRDIIAGVTYGNVSNASSLYFDDKLSSPKGHGFVAEHANHLADLYLGKDAYIVGDDNMKNGPDRLVDGVQIQSKYCSSGSKCIQECFEDGKFRYWNADGTPMQIEVPSDMYESAIQAMESRIQRGEVPGVTDPAEARNIVRKGHFTYAQVRNIAKAGTIESIAYDAASGAIIARNAFGITAVLTFATSLWNGEELDIALKSAALQGLKVGGTSFVSAVLAGQLSKAGLNSALVSSSEAIVQLMGPKAAAVLVNAFRSGTNIYGAAAMKSAAKLIRGNAITGAVSFVVLSVGDVANIFRGRISGKQLFKNLTTTASGVAGGGAGWVAGAAAGAALGSAVPLVGNAVGGFIGGLVGAFGGGTLAASATGAVLGTFVEDDADRMVSIIQDVFTELASEHLINQREAEHIADRLGENLTGAILKDMYGSESHIQFARNLLTDYFEHETAKRPHIPLPTRDQMQAGMRLVLEDMAEES